MLTYRKISDLQTLVSAYKLKGKTIGFVPTMGALHEGHTSLIKRSNIENDITIVSIYVNPTQFNDKNDLKNYPRDEQKDLAILENNHCDIVFLPNDTEMYPTEDNRVFDFEGLEDVMEGEHRPGHFQGVAKIVTKLFDFVKPHNAYFGEKDLQQYTIIKFFTKQLNIPVNVIPCPIIREHDGLAMSSRNQLLNEKQRQIATSISKCLFHAVDLAKSKTVEEIKKWVSATINSVDGLDLEYFEIVDGERLLPISDFNTRKPVYGCIAVQNGSVRLIDNVKFNS